MDELGLERNHCKFFFRETLLFDLTESLFQPKNTLSKK